jgi:uncharacterized protein (DUF2147 family)
MIRTVAFVALLASVGFAAPSYAADPSGIWLTQDQDAHIRMVKCGEGYCGTIIWLKQGKDRTSGKPLTDVHNPDPGKRNNPLIGTMVAINFVPLQDPPGRWAGRFYNADDGMLYEGSISPSGANELQVKGCLATACDTQTWTRVHR